MARLRRAACCVIWMALAVFSGTAAGPPQAGATSSPQAPVHIVRKVKPTSRPASSAGIQTGASVPQCFDNAGNPVTCNPATMLQIDYFGGHVIPNAKVYAVFWTSAVAAATQSGIGGFLQGITNSAWMDWLTEYSTVGLAGGTNQGVGRGTYAGAYTITPTSLPHACVPDSSGIRPPPGTICIWDTDVAAELDAQITAGRLPHPDQHTFYAFFFPATHVIQSFDRTFPSDSCVQYCAYHSTYTRTGSGSVYFAVHPDLAANGCQTGCGIGTTFQNLTSAVSHEIGEAITDAEVGLATTNGPPLAWYDGATVSQGEVGDMCNQQTSTFVALSGLTYTVQNLFSRSIWNASPGSAACVATNVQPTDFAIFFNPNALSVPTCGGASIPIHLETTSGTASTVTFGLSTASVLPAGVHASFSQAGATSVAPGAAAVATLDITIDSGTLVSPDQVVVVTATSGAVVHAASVLLQVASSAPAVSSNSPVCAGSPINLSTGLVAGALYSWTGPNGFTSSVQNPSIPNPAAAAFGVYSLVESVNGCRSDAGLVTVVPNVPAFAGAYPTSFVAAGATKSILPTVPPLGSTLTATASAGFTGTLTVNTMTGAVTISNAGPTGTSATITVTATDQCGAKPSTAFQLQINSFSDDPLVAGTTIVKAAHITELRTAVRAVAALAGQAPVFTDDPLPAGTMVKAVHITELRAALTAAFNALQLTVPSFTDPILTPGTTPVRAVHIQELRNALK